MDCPVCGTYGTLTFFTDRIVCVQYDAKNSDTSCGAVFDLNRDAVRESWMKKLVKSSCRGDSEFPCPQADASTGGQDLIQCPSCEALEDKELFFNADDRDREPDVDMVVDLDKLWKKELEN